MQHKLSYCLQRSSPALEGPKIIKDPRGTIVLGQSDSFVWQLGSVGDHTIYMDGNGIFGYGLTYYDPDPNGDYEGEGVRYRSYGAPNLHGLRGDLFTALEAAAWD